MKMCCISDTHGAQNQLDMSQYPADILIHAGDWTARDTPIEIINFLEWLNSQSYNHILLIAGNHECTVEDNQEWFYKQLLNFGNIIYLQNSSVTIDSINFYGSPYSNEFCNWAFMEEEEDLVNIWSKIPDNTNVLISHGPAYNCNDKVKHSYGRDPHVGSKSLTKRKKALKSTLKAHISGHIHEEHSINTSNGCINICASVLDEKYRLVNKPIILEVT